MHPSLFDNLSHRRIHKWVASLSFAPKLKFLAWFVITHSSKLWRVIIFFSVRIVMQHVRIELSPRNLLSEYFMSFTFAQFSQQRPRMNFAPFEMRAQFTRTINSGHIARFIVISKRTLLELTPSFMCSVLTSFENFTAIGAIPRREISRIGTWRYRIYVFRCRNCFPPTVEHPTFVERCIDPVIRAIWFPYSTWRNRVRATNFD
ncbi:unannotated protein [freshwater metagenome]|uniref:Unannotated protein n=1 Tax=freshwater metagenome TaxID=449393 RepID=A0A6J6CQM1_9ZZZZ